MQSMIESIKKSVLSLTIDNCGSDYYLLQPIGDKTGNCHCCDCCIWKILQAMKCVVSALFQTIKTLSGSLANIMHWMNCHVHIQPSCT